MILKIIIENLQHIKQANLELDLDSSKLFCVVGKNGVGFVLWWREISKKVR